MFGEKLTPSMFALLRADTRAGVAEAADKMGQALEVLDKLLRTHGSEKGGDYLLGGSYSMAETATTPFVRRAVVVLPQVGNAARLPAETLASLLECQQILP